MPAQSPASASVSMSARYGRALSLCTTAARSRRVVASGNRRLRRAQAAPAGDGADGDERDRERAAPGKRGWIAVVAFARGRGRRRTGADLGEDDTATGTRDGTGIGLAAPRTGGASRRLLCGHAVMVTALLVA